MKHEWLIKAVALILFVLAIDNPDIVWKTAYLLWLVLPPLGIAVISIGLLIVAIKDK